MTEPTWATTVAAWTLTYLVHSTLLVTLALVLHRLLRARPDLMSGIWKLALLGGVFTATLQPSLGVTPVGGRLELAAAHTIPMIPVVEEAAPVVASVDDAWLSEPTAELAELAAPIAAPPAAIAIAVLPSWTLVVATGIVLGALLGLASVLAAIVGLRRRLRSRRPLREGPLVAMLSRLLARAGCPHRRVALSISARTRVPLAAGVVRPAIVLPERAAVALADDQQETMLAHELAHVLRRDPAWRTIALFAERVLFFQPLNRVAADRMAQCAEYVCDDWAARHTRSPLALAQCLTEVASWVGGPSVVAASAMAAPASQLRHRVLRLLEPPRPTPGRRAAGLLAGIALAAFAWLAPGVSSGNPSAAVIRVHVSDGSDADETDVHVVGDDDGDGIIVVRAGAQDEPVVAADDEAAPHDRKRTRKAKRRVQKANRDAAREIERAMKRARKEGRATASEEEIEEILRHARKRAGQKEGSRHVELRVVVPGGMARIEVHEDGARGHGHARGRGHAYAYGHAKAVEKAMRKSAQAHEKAMRMRAKEIEKAHRRAQEQIDRMIERREVPDAETMEKVRRILEQSRRAPQPPSVPGVHRIRVPAPPAPPARRAWPAPPAPPAPAPPAPAPQPRPDVQTVMWSN